MAWDGRGYSVPPPVSIDFWLLLTTTGLPETVAR